MFDSIVLHHYASFTMGYTPQSFTLEPENNSFQS